MLPECRNGISVLSESRAGEDELEIAVWKRLPQAAHQQAHFDALSAGIGVRLVQNHVSQALLEKNVVILRSQEQVLQHGEVAQQDVGRGVSNLMARETLVRIANFVFLRLRQLCSIVWGITGIAPKGDLRQRREEVAKPTKLVICKCIQRINDNGSNAGALILECVIEHR